MMRIVMFRIVGVVLTLGVLAGAATDGRAEFLRGPDGNPVVGPDGNMVHITKLEASCGVALGRFCPELTIAPGQTLNEIICLKPYRSNLPPYCRSLVDTVKK